MIGFGQRYVESIVEYDQRQRIVSKNDTQTPELVSSKVCIVYCSHHLGPNALAHIVMHVSKSHGINGLDGKQHDGL